MKIIPPSFEILGMPDGDEALFTKKRYTASCPRKKTSVLQRLLSNISKNEDTGCWEWTKSLRSGVGYGQININGYPEYAHRAMWIATNGRLKSGEFVLHMCDNRKCINPAHLFVGSQKDNMADMSLKGRANPKKKLSEISVKNIRDMLRGGATQREIARQTGVSRATIGDIAAGRTWRNHADR